VLGSHIEVQQGTTPSVSSAQSTAHSAAAAGDKADEPGNPLDVDATGKPVPLAASTATGGPASGDVVQRGIAAASTPGAYTANCATPELLHALELQLASGAVATPMQRARATTSTRHDLASVALTCLTVPSDDVLFFWARSIHRATIGAAMRAMPWARRRFLTPLIVLPAATLGVSVPSARADDPVASFCHTYPERCDSPARVVVVRDQPPNPLVHQRGWELGVRVAVAHPGGALGAGSQATTPKVSDVAETTVPFVLDGGYRITPHLHAGAIVAWGPAFGDDSAYCFACSFRYDVQALADVRAYFIPNRSASPWVSYGAGWEVLHVNFVDGESATYGGPIFADLEFGVELRRGPVGVGPYVGFTIGEFLTRSLSPPAPHDPSPKGAAHEWGVVGVRGSYGP
jgi:hypothetical protein